MVSGSRSLIGLSLLYMCVMCVEDACCYDSMTFARTIAAQPPCCACAMPYRYDYHVEISGRQPECFSMALLDS